MHFWEQSATVLTFFSFSITRRAGIVFFSAGHSSGADVVVVVVVGEDVADPVDPVDAVDPGGEQMSLVPDHQVFFAMNWICIK